MSILPILVASLLSLSALAKDQTCNIVRVHDGDTITAACDGRSMQIRVSSIDAPELAQAWGPVAQRYAAELLLDQDVKLHTMKNDRYGRTVATITLLDGRDFARLMVRAGYAWHYVRYSVDPELAKLEDAAKQESAGIWGFGGEQIPEDYRAAERNRPRKHRPHTR